MAFPIDGVPRAAMEVPGMRCPRCRRVSIHWIAGAIVGCIEPLPHFMCLSCNYEFAGSFPAGSREQKESIKKPYMVNLWKNC